jgi:two-component system sensor histidine kinase GlrK
MAILRPRSVLQLVLVGFCAALAPLIIATLFTLQTLDKLALDNRESASLLVDVTRVAQDIANDLVELERRAGQYYALADPALADLFSRQRTELLGKLRDLENRVQTGGAEIRQLIASIDELSLDGIGTAGQLSSLTAVSPQESLAEVFSPVIEQGNVLQTRLETYVDELLARNALDTQEAVDRLTVQLVFFSLATLGLLLVFSYWITRPVRELTEEIHQLGTEGFAHSIEISGPEELRQLGSKLEWLRQQLEEAKQREQRFLRHISHEFKTPLASLREGADLLAENVAGPLTEYQQEIIDIIRENSVELQRLIENLIDYNQLPMQDPEFEQISLDTLWDEVLGHYLISMQGKSLRLDISKRVDSWVADLYKLRTALDNLLSNAVNYTPKGGEIEVVWQQSNGNLVVDIANSGDPIPEEDADSVFEPFFQSSAKRTGPIKGSGIGLSVARECMELQGGRLDLVEHPRLPVCFRLTCPAH